MMRDALIGTWRLVSWKSRDAEGRESYPMGRDASGYLTYTSDGYIWAAIARPTRPAFASQNLRKGTTEEKAAAFDTYVSYCGTYEVLGEMVIHHVQASLYPNWVGGDQERIVNWQGTRLQLSTRPTLIDGRSQTAYLIWERVDGVPRR
jgi:hypothetical protein